MPPRSTPDYSKLTPASLRASDAARAASRKRDTNCELLLRRALQRAGVRGYRVAPDTVLGRPDVAFLGARVAVFCDGDFWHGRNLDERLALLAQGHNATYWTAKIARNVARDRAHDAALKATGWTVLRYWETDLRADADAIAADVSRAVAAARTRIRR
jgi:DNA mismatch endonuclease (patch repair protein)